MSHPRHYPNPNPFHVQAKSSETTKILTMMHAGCIQYDASPSYVKCDTVLPFHRSVSSLAAIFWYLPQLITRQKAVKLLHKLMSDIASRLYVRHCNIIYEQCTLRNDPSQSRKGGGRYSIHSHVRVEARQQVTLSSRVFICQAPIHIDPALSQWGIQIAKKRNKNTAGLLAAPEGYSEKL